MAHGFKTGGRKPGSPNKRTLAAMAETGKLAGKIEEVLGPQAFSGDAHAFLMTVYKNEAVPLDLRINAARAAIKFEKPALENIEVKGEQTIRYVARVPEKAESTEAWLQQHSPELLQ